MRIINHIHTYLIAIWAGLALFCAPAGAETVLIADLFDQLQSATPEQTERIAKKIESQWSRSGSAAMDVLLSRGVQALEEKDTQAAIEHLSALIDHAPDFAHGYVIRASAYFEAGYVGPALADLEQALRLNPRHFGAMIGLAVLQEGMQMPKQALITYQKVLKIMPQHPMVQEAVARLQPMAI
ncbi:MAG: hypothetical protein CSA68_01305 [Rhodobacterales bacterium]|nr:MAG: hypothetical protein CSA68_01305 [Rhodobacterales bacterium]